MSDCIFCKIRDGQLPSAKIYEDGEILAFLDITPINPGHTLVIPKKHYVDIRDMPEALIGALFARAKEIATAVIAGVGADSFNIGMNNGRGAGQVVFHAHAHIMPRFPNDGHKLWPGKPYGEGERERVHAQIVQQLEVKKFK